jgi:hypothetical protein
LNAESPDLSIEVLIEDFCAVLQTIYPDPATAPTFLVCSDYLSQYGIFDSHLVSLLVIVWVAL